MKKSVFYVAVMALLSLLSQQGIAQNVSGKIIRAATNNTANGILDPTAPLGYTSKTTSGFLSDDVGNAKLAFKPIPAFSNEPYGDLRRGPSHLYSDFVPDASGSGVYLYFDANQNLLIRMRLGSLVPGAKGYSVLIDADGKFGASGANADPNYQAATTGVNGNPGFEIEVDLFTQNTLNPGVSVYNVDGTSSPGSPVSTLNDWLAYSQTSIAGTNDNGDPDFFLDFYVPFSALQSAYPALTTSTALRFNATTVMAPQPAIGGPKSDIYGLNDAAYKDPNAEYEAYINAQPSVSLSTLGNSGTASIGSMCTAAPTVTSPITTGATSVSGTWTRSSLTGAASTATMKIFVDGVEQTQTTSVTSTGTSVLWTVSGLTALGSGNVITAKAVATGESMCLASNSVKVSSCNSVMKPATPTLSCTNYQKGLTGTNRSTTGGTAWVIHVDNLSNNDLRNSTTDASQTYFSNMTGTNWDFSKGCTTGNQMQAGSYKIYYTDLNGCNSEPLFVCVNPGTAGSGIAGTLTTPVITSPTGAVLTTATKTISGTTQAVANGTAMTLYVDNYAVATTTASSTSPYSFSFSNLNLLQGQSIYVTSEYNTGTQSTSYCQAKTSSYIVTCFTSTPSITTDVNGQLAAGAAITGTSSEPVGTVVNVYTSTGSLIASPTVGSTGTWTTGTYTAVAGTSYYATATNGTCGISTATGTFLAVNSTNINRCGTITATTPASTPLQITTATSVVSGNLSSSATSSTVRLYQNNIWMAEQTGIINSTSWGGITIPAGRLANGDTLTIGIMEGTLGEVSCPTKYVVTCTLASTATLTFKNCSSGCTEATVKSGNTLTYTITGATVGNFYSLRDSATGKSLATGVWASSTSFDITTNALANAGSYKVQLVNSNVSSTEMCSVPSLARTYIVLPITLLEFKGSRAGTTNLLTWKTAQEINASRFEVERSVEGISYASIGSVQASGANTSYSFTDYQPQAISYYRLKLVDRDNQYKYSKVILLRDNGSGIVLNAVRPNPFDNEVKVSLVLEQAQKVSLLLMDASGRQVRQLTIPGTKGANEIALSGLSSLHEGIYVLRVSCDGALFQEKLVKMK